MIADDRLVVRLTAEKVWSVDDEGVEVKAKVAGGVWPFPCEDHK